MQVTLVMHLGGGCKTLSASGLGHCSCAASGTSEQDFSKIEALPNGPVGSQGQLTG